MYTITLTKGDAKIALTTESKFKARAIVLVATGSMVTAVVTSVVTREVHFQLTPKVAPAPAPAPAPKKK